MKTRTAVLNGKLDAGNSHVWFDAGEVASAKPRCGARLCERLLMTMAAMLLSSLSAWGDPAPAVSYTAADYVRQDDLIAIWDGLERAPAGQKDPAVWKDLKRGLQIALVGDDCFGANYAELYGPTSTAASPRSSKTRRRPIRSRHRPQRARFPAATIRPSRLSVIGPVLTWTSVSQRPPSTSRARRTPLTRTS